MGNKSANMLKQKKIAIVFTSLSLSIASVSVFSSINKGLTKITGATCSHSHVEEYNAFAPTSLSFARNIQDCWHKRREAQKTGSGCLPL